MGSSVSSQSATETRSDADTIAFWHVQPAERLVFDYGYREITQYLEAVDRIQKSGNDSKEFRDMKSMALTRLKLEFCSVLTRHTDQMIGVSSTMELSSITDSTAHMLRYEDFVVYDSPGKEVITYLRNVAKRMKNGGHLSDCIKLYKGVRKPFMHTMLKRFKMEELNVGNVKRFSPEELKMNIEMWVQAARVCINILFEKEKQLCEGIFHFGTPAADECFLETVKDAAVFVFNFPESVVVSNQSFEKMEMVLALYDGLFSLFPDINTVFSSESCKLIRTSALGTSSRLEKEVRRILSEFENAVYRDLSKTMSDDGGTIHTFTEYVMRVVSVIARFNKLLDKANLSEPSTSIGDIRILEEEIEGNGNRSPLSLHLIWIIEALQLNLLRKSKDYNDPTLGHLFMMNNVHCILQKVEDSQELLELIGDDYIVKLNQKFTQAMRSYHHSTCRRFLDCFQEEGLYANGCLSHRVSKTALRKRMKSFNDVYKDIESLQSKWMVPDLNNREKIRNLLLAELVPAYRKFLQKFSSYIQIEEPRGEQKSTQKIQALYSTGDLEALVSDRLFAHH